MRIISILKSVALVCSALAALPVTASDKVNLTLNFTPYGLHFGPVVASERGLYKAAGLEVQIHRGYGSGESVKRTALGSTEFAMADATSVVFGRDKGLAVKQIATILDRSSDAVYFRKGAGIKSPKDLEGKTFAVMAGEVHLPLFPLFAKNSGFDPEKVKFVYMDSPAKIPSLLTGKVDAMMTFATEEPNIQSAAAKTQSNWDKFAFSDFGIDNYSIGIIASDEMLKNKPDLVRRFLNATMAGYALAVEDPEAAATDFVRVFPETSREIVLGQWKVVMKHFLTPVAKEKGLGYMTDKKMEQTIELIRTYAKIKPEIKAADVFTMEFLEPRAPRKQ